MEQEEVTIFVDPAVNPFEKDDFPEFLKRLDSLRSEGEAKIGAMKIEIRDLKLNKQIDDDVRDRLIDDDKEAIAEAKVVAQERKPEVQELMGQAVSEAKQVGKAYYQAVAEVENKKIEEAKAEYAESKQKINANHTERSAAIEKPVVTEEDLEKAKAKIAEGYKEKEEHIRSKHLAPEEEEKALNNNQVLLEKALAKAEKKVYRDAKENYRSRVRAENILFHSELEEARALREGKIGHAKDTKFNAYLEKYGYISKARNNHPSILENLEYKWMSYSYAFDLKKWLLKNALYLIVLALFLIFIAVQPAIITNGNNIVNILSQTSTRLFYSLGVAGLILIAGTDLSIGRMTAMGTMFACLFLSRTNYNLTSQTFGAFSLNMADIPLGVGFLLAILVPIITCVFFSAIAGFFTAKFKMHPFITTLSTQLLIYGLLMISFASVPAFNMNVGIANTVRGGLSSPLLIVFGAIATVVIWFIWNKTKFGKYMYAVGGNPEAAKVSGINVFWVIMGIFIMAGVLYGLGGFFEGVRTPLANPNTGFGTELNAIAACVIGGVSFSGGIGKISGVVVGTLVFTGLSYCLTVMQVDTNMQFIFQGAIIMAAVCLDSLKYLKKK